jgi:hypothetical protein
MMSWTVLVRRSSASEAVRKAPLTLTVAAPDQGWGTALHMGPPLGGRVRTSCRHVLLLRGRVKAVFSEALGQGVEVELLQAVGRRDECCQFSVGVRDAG